MTTLTIEEIAALASVSRSTVSRVLNNHPSVRPTVRDRVLRIIEEHGYAPRAAARSLASQRTNVIGLLIPRSAATIFTDPFFPQVIQGISEACSSRGYFLMLSMLTADMEQSFYHRFLRSRHFDGLIMLSSDIDDPILPLLIKDRTPLVLVGRHPYFQHLSWVDVENREGARTAVAHLIGLGHRRIATITGPLQMAAGINRRDGYKQALLEAGIPIMPELMIEGDFTQEGGYQATAKLLALTERPTAIFVASDTMAIGALRAVIEANLTVPRDIAIVSFDDLPIASFANPPLTTVRQPVYEMGATAARLLIEHLEHQIQEPQQICLPTSLIIRRSCGSNSAPAAGEKGGR
ncbi:MAG: LacI family transcriptional regulator [Herpetosiphonaceae bacterium]|nr:MAG: LacI family transcriptional regulator [Herpetosiphonaceae bacterium]